MQAFTTLTSTVTPVTDNDINTDQIIPSQYLRDVNADLGYGLFAFLRRTPKNEIKSNFPLEDPRFKGSQILLVGQNFGCGSSREHAVWALQDFGFKCLIGLSFAELFRENCLKNGLLPITLSAESMALLIQKLALNEIPEEISVDLNSCQLIDADGLEILQFKMNENERFMLINGLDDIGLTLKEMEQIRSWEKNTADNKPWLTKSISLNN